MSIEARPSAVAIDATCLVVFRGEANKVVQWALTGSGTLAVFDTETDGNGQASAKLTPTGAPGDQLIVTVEYV